MKEANDDQKCYPNFIQTTTHQPSPPDAMMMNLEGGAEEGFP